MAKSLTSLQGGRLTKDVEEETLMSMGIHVLVVDCHITSLIATSRVLRESKYKVVAATNAKSALNILQEGKDKVQLVLMDTKLPDMDELEFIGIITNQYKLPVIAICHSYEDPILVDALANGAMFYMRKPVTHCQVRYLWQFISIHARRVIRESQSLNNPAENHHVLLVEGEGENSQQRKKKESKIQVMDEAQTQQLLRQHIFQITRQLTCIHSSLSEVVNIMKTLGTNKGHASSELQIHQTNSKQGQPSDAGALQSQKKSFTADNDHINLILKPAACNPPPQMKAPLPSQRTVSMIDPARDSHNPNLSTGKPPSTYSSLSKRASSQSKRSLPTKKTQHDQSLKRRALNDRSRGSILLKSSRLNSSDPSVSTAQASTVLCQPRPFPVGALPCSQNQQAQQLQWPRQPASVPMSSQMDTLCSRASKVWSKEPWQQPLGLPTDEDVQLLCPPSALPPYSPTLLACSSSQAPAAAKHRKEAKEDQLPHRRSSQYAGLVLSDLQNLEFMPSACTVLTQPSQLGDSEDLTFLVDDQQIEDLFEAIQTPDP
ncbi:hypothetical protein Dimus_025147 [Dionaea muscipula]